MRFVSPLTSPDAADSSIHFTARKSVGIMAMSVSGNPAQVYRIKSAREAVAIFGKDSGSVLMNGLISLLFQNGAQEVFAVSVGHDPSEATVGAYCSALEKLKAAGVYAVVCGSEKEEIHLALKTKLIDFANEGFEMLLFAGFDFVTKDRLIEHIAALDCKRIILASPTAYVKGYILPHGCFIAAALAGLVCSQDKLSQSFAGRIIRGLQGLSASVNQNLGVASAEKSGEYMAVHKLQTAYIPKSTDDPFGSVNSMLISDEITAKIRSLMELCLAAPEGYVAPEALCALAEAFLIQKKEEGLVTEYRKPEAVISENGGDSCEIRLDFSPVFPFEHLHIGAEIALNEVFS